MQSIVHNSFFTKLKQCGTFLSEEESDVLSDRLSEIRELKKEKNATILAHYYMPPELQILHGFGGVADFTGDSLGLSMEASKAKSANIVFCGVMFMAETAKILNPKSIVLIPDRNAGCSLAEGITGEDVKVLKNTYPGIPVIAYINTHAETKAECDVCCTSRNALRIAASFPQKRLIFIPDRFMGKNLSNRIAAETGKELILWNASCEVHEQFSAHSLNAIRLEHPQAELLLHWEVPDDSVEQVLGNGKGILGSTTDIIRYTNESDAREFILASECDLGATLKGLYPEKKFITPCIRCRHMKMISTEKTLLALRALGTSAQAQFEVLVPEPIRCRAEVPIRKMMELS